MGNNMPFNSTSFMVDHYIVYGTRIPLSEYFGNGYIYILYIYIYISENYSNIYIPTSCTCYRVYFI
jgi:hypothetical protein